MNQEQSDALERYEDAIADYDQAIRMNPDFAAAYHNRGNAKQKFIQLEGKKPKG